jgi:glycosyltransferase involved in cell wall biosynthesis
MTRVRVAFLIGHADNRWLGGTNYILNLVRAVLAVPDRRIEPVLLIPPGAPATFLSTLPDVEKIETPLVSGRSPSRIFAKLCEKLLGRNLPLEALLTARGISVLSHSPSPGRASPVPTLGWVPDFQHHRMPEFFSAAELENRDGGIRGVVDSSTLVIVSSNDAREDLIKFMPNSEGKIRTLHFTSGLGKTSEVATLSQLQEKYDFSGPYFHLPNQFWRHKNHGVVIEALSELKKNGQKALVISTGHTDDYRHPEYFSELMSKVSDLDLGEYFRVLGVVPYEDLRSLMHHARAVVNPSHFEGWSTTVEESKSLGKPIILSDIPVHREQNPERGFYFAPNDHAGLASHMQSLLGPLPADVEDAFMKEASRKLRDRVADFGRAYESIVLELNTTKEATA